MYDLFTSGRRYMYRAAAGIDVVVVVVVLLQG